MATALTSPAAPESVRTPEAHPDAGKGYELGTGLSGAAGSAANTVSEALGGPLMFPNVEKAKQALSTLKTNTTLFMTAAIPGRASNQMREILEGLAVEPGSIFSGDESSLNRLRQTRDMIANERGRMEAIMANPQGYSSSDISSTRTNYGQLGRLLSEYDNIIGGFESTPGAAPQRIQGDADFDALPSGTLFIDPEGQTRRKP